MHILFHGINKKTTHHFRRQRFENIDFRQNFAPCRNGWK